MNMNTEEKTRNSNSTIAVIFCLSVVAILLMKMPDVMKGIFIFITLMGTLFAITFGNAKGKNRKEFKKGNICIVEERRYFRNKKNEVSEYRAGHAIFVAMRKGNRVAIIQIVVRDNYDVRVEQPLYISIKKFRKKYKFSNRNAPESAKNLMMMD